MDPAQLRKSQRLVRRRKLRRNARHGRNHAENSLTDVPALQEPQELEEGDHTDDAAEVGDTSHDGSKVTAAAAEHWPSEERDEEKGDEEDGVEEDGTEGEDGDSKENVDRGRGDGLGESALALQRTKKERDAP